MSCNVCTGQDEVALQRIKGLYLEQGLVPEKIAIEYSIKYDAMRHHCAVCLSPPPSRFERLCNLIDDLAGNLDIARDTYQSDPDRADLAGAYQGMVRELRFTIESTQSLVKPEDTVGELVDAVLNPFVRMVVIQLTEELSKLKNELVAQGAPEEQVLRATKERLQALAGHLKRASQEAVANLNQYYGVNVHKTVVQGKLTLETAEATGAIVN